MEQLNNPIVEPTCGKPGDVLGLSVYIDFDIILLTFHKFLKIERISIIEYNFREYIITMMYFFFARKINCRNISQKRAKIR